MLSVARRPALSKASDRECDLRLANGLRKLGAPSARGRFVQPNTRSGGRTPCLVEHEKVPAALKAGSAEGAHCFRGWRTPKKTGQMS